MTYTILTIHHHHLLLLLLLPPPPPLPTLSASALFLDSFCCLSCCFLSSLPPSSLFLFFSCSLIVCLSFPPLFPYLLFIHPIHPTHSIPSCREPQSSFLSSLAVREASARAEVAHWRARAVRAEQALLTSPPSAFAAAAAATQVQPWHILKNQNTLKYKFLI